MTSTHIRQRLRWQLAPLVLAISAGVYGCRQADTPPIVKVYPVKGKVLLANGNPLSGGHIYFVPAKDGLISSSGVIGPDGTFSLTTGESGEGAPEGQFKVRIEADASKPQVSKAGKRLEPNQPPFPSKYADEDTSGLLVTVRPEPNELEPFQLK